MEIRVVPRIIPVVQVSNKLTSMMHLAETFYTVCGFLASDLKRFTDTLWTFCIAAARTVTGLLLQCKDASIFKGAIQLHQSEK